MDERHRWTDDRLDDLAQDVRDLRSLAEQVGALAQQMATMTERVGGIGTQLATHSSNLGQLTRDLDERERASLRESKQTRVAMWTLSVMILCALIGAATVVLSSAH